MRIARRSRWLAGLVLGLLAVARAEDASVPDRAAICAAWSELDAAWLARDVERMTRLFTEDAVFAFLPGERRLEKRDAIRAHFAAQFPNQSPALRHVTELLHLEPLAPGLALVDAQVQVLRVHDEGDAPPEVLRVFSVFAIMAAESSEQWLIRSLRAYRLPVDDERAAAAAGRQPSSRAVAGPLLSDVAGSAGEDRRSRNPFAPCHTAPAESASVEFSTGSPDR